MTDSEYLQATNVVRLQSAARMAGLRFKSGTLDKAGIVSTLQNHPSIMRACISVLQRMEQQDFNAPQSTNKTNSLMDDLSDELENDTPKASSLPSEGTIQPAPVIGEKVDLSQFVKRPELVELAKRVNNDIDKMQTSLESAIEAIKIAQERRPIQINLTPTKSVTIDPLTAHKSFAKLVIYLQVNRRVILTGSAGTGKSMAVKNAAAELGVPFYLVPPVTMSHELIGHRDAQGVFHETPLTLAYKHGGLCLLDEADASLPDALLCANPILDGNGFATLGDGILHQQHADFFAVFNMNTDGNGATMQYAGRNRLDGATLARFGVRINWEVDARIETNMAQGHESWYRAVLAVRQFMQQRDIIDVNATPRHTKTGAQLLAAGCSKNDVLTDVLFSGALAQVWADVCRLPAVSTFLRS